MTRNRTPNLLPVITAVILLAVGLVPSPSAAVVSMADYTSYPIFVNQAVPPDILFIVDLSDAMLPAAYGAYPLSYPSSGGIGATYASNYKGSGLTVTTTPPGSTTPTPLADTFNPNISYFGTFDSLSCYTASNSQFGSRVAKTASVSDACANTQWDGNFLNWLSMRKIDLAKKVLIGGRTLSASNNDGTANTLLGEPKTGQGGSTNTCNSTSKSCFRYVKFVPSMALTGRVPTSLAADTGSFATGSEAPGTITTNGVNVVGVGTYFTQQFQVNDAIQAAGQTKTVASITDDTHLTINSGFTSNLATATSYYAPGRYFGLGEGTIYVNSGSTVSPFCSSGCTYPIQVDLTSETDAYRQQQSLGLLQNLRTDNMRVAVMFTNSNNGVAATLFRAFDGIFNASAITGIRNQALSSYAALAEATYEGLCYYSNAQGPCFNNSPADFTASVGAQGDPYFFVSMNQSVRCCKSFILMISSGQPSNDQNNTPSPAPFGNLLTAGTDTVGLPTTRLDDVSFYGQTNDLRSDLIGTQNVTFYAVNAMGGTAGASVLASAALYGGFRGGGGLPALTGQTCTYPAGSNLGSGSGTSNAAWDLNQDCTPDTYFDASQGSDLINQINSAIADILKKAASGTSVSVLATSSTGEGSVYQAYFLPAQFEGQNEIAYTGFTQGLFLDGFGNIREDTDGDGRLIYERDKIIKTQFNTSSNDVDVVYYTSGSDGIANLSSATTDAGGLRRIHTIWEAGRRLALTSPSSRTILTWVDLNNNGVVDAGEQMQFSSSNSATLGPYFALSLSGGAAPYTADNIVSFILGNQVSGLRNRQITVTDDSGNPGLQVWKMGDPANSTPTVVGAPKERFDVIYGDASYTAFFQQYKSRRQVVYVGANDGMLHAFNAGFYHRGDDPSTPGVTEHGWFTRTATDNSGGPLLGQELWGFVPYNLLPHLQWLANPSYTHVYYVDLKPKVTDVRIFTADADHPNGWGTILIGGMRMGGSCGACTPTTGGTPMSVSIGGTTRTFYSAYFVLDITNPERAPVLLWSFTDSTLGFTTAYPSVLRMNPSTSGKTDNANAKWFVIVGSGPTGYDGSSAQTGTIFAIDLQAGPKDSSGNSLVSRFPLSSTTDAQSFIGDVISLDADLDFRTDVAYMGNAINNGSNPVWIGKLYRLTTNGGNTSPATWGIASGANRTPTVLLATFPSAGTYQVGPITAAPGVTADDSNKIWVFWGSGRFYSSIDKTNTDTQYFFGVKDLVMGGGCTQSSVTNCQFNNLLNVSAVTVCNPCDANVNQVSGVTGVTTFDQLAAKIQGTATTPGMDGWYTTLTTAGERVLSAPTILGGTVFFTTFIPSSDVCTASGNGNVYALFYKTGGPNKESVIGTYTGTGGGASNAACTGSSTCVRRAMSLGTGLPSQMAVQIGGQGSGASGTSSSQGCSGRVTGFIQGSTGVLNQFCGKPALSSWSHYVSWISQRD